MYKQIVYINLCIVIAILNENVIFLQDSLYRVLEIENIYREFE